MNQAPSPHNAPNEPNEPQSMTTFYWVWFGQLVSILGSAMTTFALGIWILQQSADVTQFATVTILATLPGILLSTIAGVYADRYDRRILMIATDIVAVVTTILVLYLYSDGRLEIWHIYLATAIDSIAVAFQLPAFISATTMIVPVHQLGRAGGMMQVAESLSAIAGPFLAGLILTMTDLKGILILDIATFLFGVGVLLFVRFPHPPTDQEDPQPPSLWREAMAGKLFIFKHKGLVWLTLYAALINFVGGIMLTAVMPLAIHFADELQIGTIMTAGGIGSLLGGLYMTLTGGPQPKIKGIFIGTFCVGFCIALIAWQPHVWTVASGMFAFQLLVPIIAGCNQVIWQTIVPPNMQGRVFSSRRLLTQFTLPAGALAAGPLADLLFEPLMTEGSTLATTFGPLIGTGPGRGIALMLLFIALLPILITLLASTQKELRNIEANHNPQTPNS